MDFLEVPLSQQFLGGFSSRQMPEQLNVDPTMPVPFLPFGLTVLHRRWDPATEECITMKKIVLVAHCSSWTGTRWIGQEKYPRGLPRAEKGVGTRWNSIQQAVYDQDERRRLIAAVFPIALAHGEDYSKTKVG
jgi:hypothetical protein